MPNSSNVDANVTSVVDAISLLAEFEIYGTRSYANQYEKNHQTQMAYYKNGNSKVHYAHDATGQVVRVWEASPHYDNTNAFCNIISGGGADITSAFDSYGLAPAFKT